jgi:hypothetical protein
MVPAGRDIVTTVARVRYDRGVSDDSYVLLCECRNTSELQLVRSALQAHDVPMRVIGEAAHGVLGAIHGAALMPRVLVPKAWLPTAQGIAADVVGPFDETDQAEDDEATGSPFREGAAELDATEPTDVGDDEDDETPMERPKFLGVPLLLALFGLAVGLGHIYARRMKTGLVLLAIAAGSVIVWIAGNGAGVIGLAAVEAFDLVGGLVGVVLYNRALRQRSPRS